MNATGQFFPMVVYYAIQGGPIFESVGEILKCDHSKFNESYCAVQYFPLVLFTLLFVVLT